MKKHSKNSGEKKIKIWQSNYIKYLSELSNSDLLDIVLTHTCTCDTDDSRLVFAQEWEQEQEGLELKRRLGKYWAH